jgi:hypothetical protein
MKVNVYKNLGFYLLLLGAVFGQILNADVSSARQRRAMTAKKGKAEKGELYQDIIKDETLQYTPTNTMVSVKVRVGFLGYRNLDKEMKNRVNDARKELKTTDVRTVMVDGYEGEYLRIQDIQDAIAKKLKETGISYSNIKIYISRHKNHLKPHYFLNQKDFPDGLTVRVELVAGK